MAKLRKKMVITFLLITTAGNVCNELIDWVTDLLGNAFEKNQDKAGLFFAAIIGFLILNIMVYVMSGFVFYLVTKKNIKEESERQIHEKDLIYAAIAHDLKTPMTSVQGFAKALSDGKVSAEEQKEIADIIYHKSNSMNEMIDTLFEYSKLGTEKYAPQMTKLDICSLVRDIAAESYTDFEEHDIELDIDIPDEEIMINADKNELKRAVSNLAANVYKHNPEGIRAKISVGKEKGKAVVKISDSGNALAEDTDIFEPFVTENTSRTPGHGTGLGLAITKRIIERHNAKIYVDDSEEGYIKSFVIEINDPE